jgi:hypothetical protein
MVSRRMLGFGRTRERHGEGAELTGDFESG